MNKKIIIILYALMFYLSASAQLFHSLGLDFNGGERQGNFSQPRMHVEGDMLYVCTCQGLYFKDLSSDNSAWQLVGFEGVSLQDYARRGNDILALRYNEGGNAKVCGHARQDMLMAYSRARESAHFSYTYTLVSA